VFALWNDSADLAAAGSINSGEVVLELEDGTGGAWYLENPQGGGGPVTVASISNYVISPGDQLSYKGATFSGHVTGSDIEAKLDLAASGVGAVLLDPAVEPYVSVSFMVGGVAATTLQGTVAAPTAHLGGSAGATPVVDAYITFDPATPNTGTGGPTQQVTDAIDFSSGLDLVLQQL
jgi:alternate signal-mediated exported protein